MSFTGHRENRDIGLTYMNARFYVPSIARFASADTIVPDREDPQSFNRYSYVYNNPLRFTDPSGHRICEGLTACDPSPPPILSTTQPLPVEALFDGLPVAMDSIIWANGFGANSYANTYANPNSESYDETYQGSAGLHPGLDFGADAGTPVYSNVQGEVQIPSPYPGDAGNPANVVILLNNGMAVVFGHVQGIEGLTSGMEVKPGDLIGRVGDLGDNSHVHLALRESTSSGERVYNPANYFADLSILEDISWSGYIEGENLYSISSFLYQPTDDPKNFWVDGELAVEVTRP
jgi:RHS repeat-associated protein